MEQSKGKSSFFWYDFYNLNRNWGKWGGLFYLIIEFYNEAFGRWKLNHSQLYLYYTGIILT